MWALFAIGTALLTSLNPIFYKRMLRDAEPLVVIWGVTLIALPLLGLFALLLTPQAPGIDLVFVAAIIGAGVLNVLAHLANTTALKRADASLVTPLLNFGPVFTLLLALPFLGETPSTAGVIGVLFVLLGAYWLTRTTSASWLDSLQSLSTKSEVLLVLLAGLFWSITPLLEKVAIQHTFPQSPRFTAFVATATLVLFLSWPVVRRRPQALTPLVQQRSSWLAAGLIAGVAPMLGYTAMSLGLVGYVTTLFKLSSVLTVLWAALFLGERNLTQRLPAAALMVIGVVIMAL